MLSHTFSLLPNLQTYMAAATREMAGLPAARKEVLSSLTAFVQEKLQQKQAARLVFICTHNSRRSHMSQIWAQVAAAYYQLPHVHCYSGGTEATAFNPRAVAAMQEAGLEIKVAAPAENPVYTVHYAPGAAPLSIWSKQYNDAANPATDFAAIMTCAHADEHCPFIPGATKRLPIRYNDPKDFDGTAQEALKYRERAHQIAVEMLYAFSLVKL